MAELKANCREFVELPVSERENNVALLVNGLDSYEQEYRAEHQTEPLPEEFWELDQVVLSIVENGSTEVLCEELLELVSDLPAI